MRNLAEHGRTADFTQVSATLWLRNPIEHLLKATVIDSMVANHLKLQDFSIFSWRAVWVFVTRLASGSPKMKDRPCPKGLSLEPSLEPGKWLGHAGSLPLSSSDSVLTVHVQHMDDFKIFQDVPFFGTYPLVICYSLLWKITIFNGKIHYFYGHVQ